MIKIKLIGTDAVRQAIFEGAIRSDDEVFPLGPAGVQTLDDYVRAHTQMVKKTTIRNAYLAVNVCVYKDELPEDVIHASGAEPKFPVFFARAFTVAKRALVVKRVLILRGWSEPTTRSKECRLVPYRLGSDWFDSFAATEPADVSSIKGCVDPLWSPTSDVAALPLPPEVRVAARIVEDAEIERILRESSNTSIGSLLSTTSSSAMDVDEDDEEDDDDDDDGASTIPSLLDLVDPKLRDVLMQNTTTATLF